jgi:hypothetical protein|tara:strand:- start:331 stop:579 length:249 start_codon:yes stop_codon:yes gene_type:complete
MTNWSRNLVSKKISPIKTPKKNIFQKIVASIPIILDIPETSDYANKPPPNYSFKNDMICCGLLLITVNYVILTYLPNNSLGI